MVTIEGEPGEIQALLDHYSNSNKTIPSPTPLKKKASNIEPTQAQLPTDQVDYSKIVNFVKNCDEAEAIERQILDKTSQVDRTLLPLYIVYKYLNNEFALTSGDINKITTELGIPIATPNASKTLSGTAYRYVIGDHVRIKGQPVRYRLSRRGVQYLKSVISGAVDDNKE